MNRLEQLRRELIGLAHRRRRLRRATAAAAVLAACLVLLLAMLWADWAMNMSRAQRAAMLALGVGALVWVVRRYVRPWLFQREGPWDMALLVERQAAIDSDVIAALQFESTEARRWGSPALRQAVIDSVAERSPDLPLEPGLPTAPLRRRTRLLALAVVGWLAVAVLCPRHVAVFFQRIVFSQKHYPSRTSIVALSINGVAVDATVPGRVAVAQGRSARFEMTVRGKLPESGEVRLVAAVSGSRTTIELKSAGEQPGRYVAETGGLSETLDYQCVVNDAWTESGRLDVVALPTADLQFEVLPPSYASVAGGRMPPGLRQVSVVEGSRVMLRLLAFKPLQQATVNIAGREFPLRLDRDRQSKPQSWLLDDPQSPLFAVVEPVAYSIQVLDVDKMSLEKPIEGAIRVEPDLKPKVAGAIVSPQVLPTALPTVYYRAGDDFGLARLVVARQVVRADGQVSADEIEVYAHREGQPLSKELNGQTTIDLSPLGLHKGDEVRVELRATDFRGPRVGQTGVSAPLVFQVTDEQGILSMINQSDRLSAEQLKTMIQRQLDLGARR